MAKVKSQAQKDLLGSTNAAAVTTKTIADAEQADRELRQRAHVLAENWWRDHQETLRRAVEIFAGTFTIPAGNQPERRLYRVHGEIKSEIKRAAQAIAQIERIIEQNGPESLAKIPRHWPQQMPEFDDAKLEEFAHRLRSRDAVAQRNAGGGKPFGWKALRPAAVEIRPTMPGSPAPKA